MRNLTLPAMLAGYLFLLIFRPYEYWPILGTFRIERVYMLVFMGVVFLTPNKRFVSSPVNYALAAFCFTLIISSFGAFNGSYAFTLVEKYLKFVVFYVMMILTIRDERDFRYILFAFIAVMAIYVGKSMWEFFIHGRYVYRMGIKRLVGIDVTYGDPNSFAATICYSLPLLWALLCSRSGTKWVRRGLWAYGSMALVAILFTGSRSGMVTAILFFLLVLLGSSRKFVVMIALLVGFVFSWDFMPEYLKERFLSTFGFGEVQQGAAESAAGRMAGFKQGMSLFRDNPLLGFGPNNFYFGWPGEAMGHNAHNLFGQLAGELGLAGILSFGSLLLTIYLINKRIQVRFPKVLRALAAEAASTKRVEQRDTLEVDRNSLSSRRKYRMKGEVVDSNQGGSGQGDLQGRFEGETKQSSEERFLSERAAQERSYAPRYRLKRQAQDNALPNAPAAADAPQPAAGHVEVSRRRRKKNKPVGLPLDAMQKLGLYPLVSRAIIQTMILLLFKGWADHNLYRYSWLWLAALTVLTAHFFTQEVRRYARS